MVRSLKMFSQDKAASKLNPDAVGRLSLVIRCFSTKGEQLLVSNSQNFSHEVASHDGTIPDQKNSSLDLFKLPEFSIAASVTTSLRSVEDQVEAICGSTKFTLIKASKLEQVYQLTGNLIFSCFYFYYFLCKDSVIKYLLKRMLIWRIYI